MRIVHAAILLTAGLLLGGCFGDSSSDGEPSLNPTDPTSGNGAPPNQPAPPGFKALFQPTVGVLPYPIDLFFSGTTDGTLNMPITSFNSNAAALNNLDGFSTVGVIRARFGAPIDPATLNAANVRVVRLALSNTTKAPLPPTDPGFLPPQVLTFGTAASGADLSIGTAQEQGGALTLEITPNRPLQPSTGATNIGYLVLLTRNIRSVTGTNAVADAEYALVRDQAISEIVAGASTPSCAPITNTTLRAVCQLTFAQLRLGAAVGIPPTDVVLSFSFTTQSTADSLAVVSQIIAGSPAPPLLVASPMGTGPTGNLTTRDIIPQLPGAADVFMGTVRIPYYLTAPSAAVPNAPLTRFWTAAAAPPVPGLDPSSRNLTRFNPVPLKTADLDIPVVVTVPNALAGPAGARPPTGWPVAIFQHGLTRNRFDVLPIADSFAAAGFVVVSIDIPLHGVVPSSPLAPFRQVGRERTFDTDLVNNATLATVPDGVVDGSGQLFVNLSSLLTTRDNLRQAAVDLLALTRAVPNLEVTGDTTPDVDTSRIHFVGHSLGSIVGGTYATFGTNARTASLLMTGGGVANTINDSPAFGPLIRNGLANLSGGLIVPGTTLFNQFLRDAQHAVDSGDPLNYIRTLLAAKPVHIVQVIGAPPTWQPDLVVPNSSTQRMINTGGTLLRRLSAAGPNPMAASNGGYVNFIRGHHGSIIDPSCSTPPVGPDPAACAATTAEMQRQVVTFAASNGTAVVLTNTAVIQPP